MTLKNLLVQVGADRANAARLDYAIRLAKAQNAHLTALHVPALAEVPGYVMAELPPAVVDVRERLLREEVARLTEEVRKAGVAGGLDIEWRAVAGGTPEFATLHARHADLTVVGQGLDDRSAPDGLAETLIMGSGRPVLLVPSYGTFQRVGERIMVAWNATREAARALNDALPLLKRAQQVVVLSVDPRQGERRTPGADIALHLARHGVKAEASTAYGDDLSVGDVILSRSADLGVDMIVMGAYGHSRAREFILGGATRHILRHMTVPAFMSH
jgi:nucleotide-binding universal stress UspA family protein